MAHGKRKPKKGRGPMPVIDQSKTWKYLKVRLAFDKNSQQNPTVDSLQLKTTILDALRVLFGEIGKATLVDVLKYDPKTQTTILRTKYECYKLVWQALTVYNQFGGVACSYHMEQQSDWLIGLSANSRTDPMLDDIKREREAEAMETTQSSVYQS